MMVEQLVMQSQEEAIIARSRLKLNQALARLETALIDYQERQAGHADMLAEELDGYIKQLGQIINEYQ